MPQRQLVGLAPDGRQLCVAHERVHQHDGGSEHEAQDGAVEGLAGVLTGGHLADDRAEEGDAVDVHDRGADVVADRVHARVVALLQRLVVLGGGRGLGE